MNKILIIGCGEHSKIVIENIEQQNKYKIVGLVGFDKKDLKKKIFNYPVLCLYENISIFLKKKKDIKFYFIGIGVAKNNMKIREKIINEMNKLLKTVNIIHPLSIVSKYAKIGKGNLFEAYSKLSCDCTIGNYCVIESFSSINHDQIIEDNVFIATNVSCAGKKIGRNTIIADGVTVGFKKAIGSNCLITDGVTVTKNIQSNKICYGNPIKIINNNF
jgi:sugar O-acyltransferase (sialic acid O-acetyltransferase NeuD family)